MKTKTILILVILIITSLFSFAQEVEIQGKLKVSDVTIDNEQEILLVKQSDGTFAGRELSSLPLPPPTDERSFSSDIELAKSLCECGGNIPPFLVESALDNGYSFKELYDAGVPVYNLMDAGITLQMFLDTGYTPNELLMQGLLPEDFYGLNYQGGIIFYLEYGGAGMVCTSEDQTSAIWGCEGTEITGADEEGIGFGYQNTLDILAECTTPGIAAEVCEQLVFNGYDDWVLPSVEELEAVKNNLYLTGLVTFEDYLYWCSTEYSNSQARCVYFDPDAFFNYRLKNETHYVRAVRSFSE